MNYLLECEDSAEGIFSGVYAAWELKHGLDQTDLRVRRAEGRNMELFAEYVPVKPDSEKAGKVLHTLRVRGSEQLAERAYYAACAAAEDRAGAVYRFVRLTLRMGPHAMECLTEPCVMRVLELSRAVGNETHHYLGFLRFIELPNRILLARYTPKNDITELVLPHFADRFSGERFVLWDTGRGTGAVYERGTSALLRFDDRQTELLRAYTEDRLPIEELWKAFVESISISARENRALQQSNLPLRFRTYLPEFASEELRRGTAGERWMEEPGRETDGEG